jgi:mRNA interferase RelE/StbE
MEIEYSKKSMKFLAKQSKTTVQRIRDAVWKLTLNPPEGDIKAMHGADTGKMRLRVGQFRIIYWYTTDNRLKILYVDEIGNRGDIYK